MVSLNSAIILLLHVHVYTVYTADIPHNKNLDFKCVSFEITAEWISI